jgi:hypothetical protein
MIKKYGEFLNENSLFSGYDLKEFTKTMSAEAFPIFSVVKFSDTELEKYITVIYDATEGNFIISEKIAITSKSVDVDKISENHKVETVNGVKEAISVSKIMYLFSKGKAEHEVFFDRLIEIVQKFENREKTFDDLKPLFLQEVKAYEDDYEVTLDNFILEYIGMPPHNLASRKFGL